MPLTPAVGSYVYQLTSFHAFFFLSVYFPFPREVHAAFFARTYPMVLSKRVRQLFHFETPTKRHLCLAGEVHLQPPCLCRDGLKGGVAHKKPLQSLHALVPPIVDCLPQNSRLWRARAVELIQAGLCKQHKNNNTSNDGRREQRRQESKQVRNKKRTGEKYELQSTTN